MELKKEALEKYLEKKYGKKVIGLTVKKLGSGVLGTGYLLDFTVGNTNKHLIIKSLFTENLGMDHYADRASSLIEAHDNYNTMDEHVKSEDVIGASANGSLISVGEAHEFYILMQEAKGKDLFKDFDEIKNGSTLTEMTKNKVKLLADFLVRLHT